MQTALAAADSTVVESHAPAPALLQAVRRTEWIIFAFLIYAPALAFILPAPDGLGARLMSVNLVVMLFYAGLISLHSAKPRLCWMSYAIGCRSA